jgi:chemotaxis protein MotB
MAGKGGGAWKVAYADFVTAMMAFFLVMWITAQSKPMRQAIAQYFENPTGSNLQKTSASEGQEGAKFVGPMNKGQGPRQGFAAKSSEPPERGRHAPKASKVLVFRDPVRSRSAGAIVQFEPDSVELTGQGQELLRRLVPQLLGKPNKVEVRGHTSRKAQDNADPPDDWQLCYERCRAVMQTLVDLGVEPERIRLSQDGPFEPYATERHAEARAANSRVEVFAIAEYAHRHKADAQAPAEASALEDPAAQ